MTETIYTGKEKIRVQKAIALIQRELKDLDVPQFSMAYKVIFQNALEASDIMTSKELKQYISDYLDTLPNSYLY